MLAIPGQKFQRVLYDFFDAAQYFRSASSFTARHPAIRTRRDHCRTIEPKFYADDFEGTAAIGTKVSLVCNESLQPPNGAEFRGFLHCCY
jgi:hypothetical protein